MYVWSAKANGFFPISEKEKFEASGLWPDDGVIVSEEEHKKLFMDIPPRKQIGTLNGKPALIDIPQPTKKELIAIAEVKKSQLRKKLTVKYPGVRMLLMLISQLMKKLQLSPNGRNTVCC
ncbi:Phage tail fiber assembly protein [Escherichia coli]|nr:Phage tail fiber assembly protein [Escherichia coli]